MADTAPRPDTPTANEHPPSPTLQDRKRGIGSIIIGAALTIFAPLTGFLGGTIVRSSDTISNLDSLYLWLFGGMFIGAIGVIIAIIGALRWTRANHRSGW